jgi:hypothetical protein
VKAVRRPLRRSLPGFAEGALACFSASALLALVRRFLPLDLAMARKA